MRPVLFLMAGWTVAFAHKFEFSTADVDWVSASSTVEIVLSLHTDDIEAYLRKTRQPELEIDRDKAAEALVCEYVLTVFEIRQTPLRCIGIKPGLHFTEVYLEGSPRNRNPPPYLRNEILAKQHPNQKNLVNLKQNNRPIGRSLEFTAAGGWKSLPWKSD